MADTDYSFDQQTNGEGGFEQYDQQQQQAAEPMEGQETEQNAGGEGDNADEDDRKLFVGNLSWETSQKDLRDYFAKFGEVTSCTLKTDLESKRSRGFGFVVFSTVASVEKVLQEKTHSLGGRNIDPKRANPRKKEEPIKKIFVGKVDPSITEDEIKSYFGQFGEVKKVELPFDKVKDQRRAFCFVEFESEDSIKKVTDQEKHKIKDQEVDVKKATPTNQAKRGRGGFWQGGYPSRGGWNQGYGQGGYGQGYGYGGYGYGGYNQGYGYGGYGPGGYGGGYDGGSWGYGQGGYDGYGYGYGDGSYDQSYNWGYDQDQYHHC